MVQKATNPLKLISSENEVSYNRFISIIIFNTSLCSCFVLIFILFYLCVYISLLLSLQ